MESSYGIRRYTGVIPVSNVLPYEDCVFRLDYKDKWNQQFGVTYEDVGLTDEGFYGGSVTSYIRESPVYVEIIYDGIHIIDAYSSGIVDWTDGILTIDCSNNCIELVSIYSRALTSTEVKDRYKARTFMVE